jgi:serine/threonine protein kinase
VRAHDPVNVIGCVVGEYVITDLIGQGGMAAVYRARHTTNGTLHAVKCIPFHGNKESARAQFQRAFEREARLLELLCTKTSRVPRFLLSRSISSHHGTDVGCIVMELMTGKTLRDHIAANPGGMEIVQAVSLLEPIVEALAYAHRVLQAELEGRLIAHLDLKPENIFLKGEFEEPTLIDLGVARRIAADPSARSATTFSSMAFTPLYGAPEQFVPVHHGELSARTDVFALALVLVELVTGKVALVGAPFEALEDDGLADRARRAALDPGRRPTLRALGVACSDAVDAVLTRALAVTAAERFDDVVDFWLALSRSIEHNPLWVLSKLGAARQTRTATPPAAVTVPTTQVPPEVRPSAAPTVPGPEPYSAAASARDPARASFDPGRTESLPPGLPANDSVLPPLPPRPRAPAPSRLPLPAWLLAGGGFVAVALAGTVLLVFGSKPDDGVVNLAPVAIDSGEPAGAQSARAPVASVMPLAPQPAARPCSEGSTLCPDLGCVPDADMVNGKCPPPPGSPCPGPHMMGEIRSGRCEVKWCEAGYGDCDKSREGCETHTSSDVKHCGSCAGACKIAPGSHVSAQKCVSAQCVLASCEPGWLNCDGSATQCSTDINTTVEHCGGCNHPCQARNANASCSGGACSFTCKPGFACKGADGSCKDTSSDVSCCGASASRCQAANATPAGCVAGKCRFTCNPSFACQGPDGSCKDTRSDPECCGARAAPCRASNATPTGCDAGKCRFQCNPGFACQDASGSCKSQSTDPTCCGPQSLNCNAQIDPATMTASCVGGECRGQCSVAGMTPHEVGGGRVKCFDLQGDKQNCGAFGNVCSSSLAGGVAACERGQCVSRCPPGQQQCAEGASRVCRASCPPPPPASHAPSARPPGWPQPGAPWSPR